MLHIVFLFFSSSPWCYINISLLQQPCFLFFGKYNLLRNVPFFEGAFSRELALCNLKYNIHTTRSANKTMNKFKRETKIITKTVLNECWRRGREKKEIGNFFVSCIYLILSTSTFYHRIDYGTTPHKLVIIDLKNGVDFTSARKQDFHFRSSGKHT